MQESWSCEWLNDLLGKLGNCSAILEVWGRKLRTKWSRAIQSCKRDIANLSFFHDDESEKLLAAVKSRLGVLLMQEEDFWHQRSKVHWLKEGDRNTKFFHAMAIQRKGRNAIRQLKNDMGVMIDDQSGMCEIAKSYFNNLFRSEYCNYAPVVEVLNPRVTMADNSLSCAPFTRGIQDCLVPNAS